MAKTKEVSSRLLRLDPMITVLIETGVNKHKAYKIKGKLHLKGMFMNNYQNHENGRFWIWWNNKKVEVRKISSSMQNIHCGVLICRAISFTGSLLSMGSTIWRRRRSYGMSLRKFIYPNTVLGF